MWTTTENITTDTRKNLAKKHGCSVYSIPVYEVLERGGFEVLLVPPRMTKHIAGRKSDMLDCQWIWQLLCYGLLRGTFCRGDAGCPLRSYMRQMKRLTEDRALHMLYIWLSLAAHRDERPPRALPGRLRAGRRHCQGADGPGADLLH